MRAGRPLLVEDFGAGSGWAGGNPGGAAPSQGSPSPARGAPAWSWAPVVASPRTSWKTHPKPGSLPSEDAGLQMSVLGADRQWGPPEKIGQPARSPLPVRQEVAWSRENLSSRGFPNDNRTCAQLQTRP